MDEAKSAPSVWKRVSNRLFGQQGAKIWGIFGLLVAICAYTAASSNQFLMVRNVQHLVHPTALYGMIGISAAFVIITGGIDPSIGSRVCLVGVLLPYLLTHENCPIVLAVVAVLFVAV